MERLDRRGDGLRRLAGLRGCARRPVRRDREQRAVDREAIRGQGSAHAPYERKSAFATSPLSESASSLNGFLTRGTSRGSRLRRRARSLPPSARNGPSGIACLRAARPWRTSSTIAGTAPAMKPRKSPTTTDRPRPAPMNTRELHVPHSHALRIRENDEEQRQAGAETRRAPTRRSARRASAQSATRTAPGSTIRSGISRCSRSVRVTITRTQQKNAAIAGLEREAEGKPGCRSRGAAVPAVTSGKPARERDAAEQRRVNGRVGRESIGQRADDKSCEQAEESRGQVHRSRFPERARVPPRHERSVHIPHPEDWRPSTESALERACRCFPFPPSRDPLTPSRGDADDDARVRSERYCGGLRSGPRTTRTR